MLALASLDAKVDVLIRYILWKETNMPAHFDALKAAIADLSVHASAAVGALAAHHANSVTVAEMDALTQEVVALSASLSATVASSPVDPAA